MCGIAALFAYHADAHPVTVAELLDINQAMLRRGPDGGGHWIDKQSRVALAHRRLAIIDLSTKAGQPMTRDGLDGTKDRFRITFNGEIYNFRALRIELESEGVNFTTQSDTEVLIRLYERDGPDMAPRLRGMYAFAIWDSFAERMFLARDHFGIKPLYIADDGKTLRVASQLKALKAGGHAGKAGPNPAGHVGFYLFGSVPDPHTLYADIQALPAGSTLSIEKGGKRRLTTFFDPAETLREASEKDAPSESLREMLLDSVKHHFVADVPVGLFLSAGLDSTTLTGLSTEAEAGEIRTFTLGFEEFENTTKDEVPLAEQVAEHYGTTHLTERITRMHFDSALPAILHAMDQPSVDGINTFFIARVAAQGGLKVAISGLGGDELFAGYDTFRQVPKLASTLGAIPGVSGFGKMLRTVTGPMISAMTSPKYAGLLELGSTLGGAYLLKRGLFMPWELPHLMEPEMARAGWQALEPITCLNEAVVGVGSPQEILSSQNKIRVLETTRYMCNQLLRDADWAGMAHSLEIRVPLVDPMLFSMLAPLLGGASSPTKRDMALTPDTALPNAIINHPKTGFFVPVERWMKERAGREGNECGLRGWARKVFAAHTG